MSRALEIALPAISLAVTLVLILPHALHCERNRRSWSRLNHLRSRR